MMTIEPRAAKHLLVIGCGDIGGRIPQFLDAFWSITGLNRSARGSSDRVHYFSADYQKPATLIQSWPDLCDELVLTLTPSSYTDEGYQSGYVEGCKAILEAIDSVPAPAKPQRIVFLSSTSVYGQNDGSWIDEKSPTNPTHFNGQRLLEAEETLLQAGIPVLNLRCSGLYGPNRYRLLNQLWQGKSSRLSPHHYTNRVHVDDCAAIIAHQLNADSRSNVDYLIASDDEPVLYRDVERFLLEEMGKQSSTPSTPTSQTISGKRCSNAKLTSLGIKLRYPNYRRGYSSLIQDFLQQGGTGQQ